MSDEMNQEFRSLSDQIRKGFDANDRQFRLLKTRMAKMELELETIRRATNKNTVEVAGLKTR
jgi:hypothetical protein